MAMWVITRSFIAFFYRIRQPISATALGTLAQHKARWHHLLWLRCGSRARCVLRWVAGCCAITRGQLFRCFGKISRQILKSTHQNITSWWFGTFLYISYFPIYWEKSSQLTFIFFRGVGKYTTNQINVHCHLNHPLFFFYLDGQPHFEPPFSAASWRGRCRRRTFFRCLGTFWGWESRESLRGSMPKKGTSNGLKWLENAWY